jgi:hypothetical protein
MNKAQLIDVVTVVLDQMRAAPAQKAPAKKTAAKATPAKPTRSSAIRRGRPG